MTIQKERAFRKDRYTKGYQRSFANGWHVRSDDREMWLEWIADPRVMSDYVEGRIAGEKAFRLKELLQK